jgi:hypothetical protein
MYFLNCKLWAARPLFILRQADKATTSELLGYGQSNSAYYIECHDCQEDFASNAESQFWTEWEKSIHDAEEKLKARYTIQLS